MSATVETKVLIALRTAITGISSPTLTVVEGAQLGTTLPNNTVQLTPLADPHEEAPADKRRWQFRVLVLLRSTLGTATSTVSGYEAMFLALRALLAAIKAATALQGGGSVGVERTRREDVVIWGKLGAKPGDPVGAAFVVEASWVE